MQRFPPGADIPAVWTLPVGRRLQIGAKYKQNAGTAYCVGGCAECDPMTGRRCWQRRTQLTFMYRLREVIAFDIDLGRAYVVSLVRPDIWQMRAFCLGTRRIEPAGALTWHTLTGLIWEADVGDDAV